MLSHLLGICALRSFDRWQAPVVARPRGSKKLAKKKTKKKNSRRGPVLDSVVAVPGVDPVAMRLTSEILELDRNGKRRVANNVVAIGRRLVALQQRLGFGDWLRWLSDRLPYSPRTAQRYIALAQWAETFPGDFEHFAHLGIGKIQLLATLTVARRRRFRERDSFRIPSTGVRKSLEIMTHLELASVISASSSLQAQPPAIPAAKILQRFRHRVAGLDAMADQLRARAEELDEDDVREVYDEMLAVAEELEVAFGF